MLKTLKLNLPYSDPSPREKKRSPQENILPYLPLFNYFQIFNIVYLSEVHPMAVLLSLSFVIMNLNWMKFMYFTQRKH